MHHDDRLRPRTFRRVTSLGWIVRCEVCGHGAMQRPNRIYEANPRVGRLDKSFRIVARHMSEEDEQQQIRFCAIPLLLR